MRLSRAVRLHIADKKAAVKIANRPAASAARKLDYDMKMREATGSQPAGPQLRKAPRP